MAGELAEYKAESRELRNQEHTIRRLEEKARSLEAQLEDKASFTASCPCCALPWYGIKCWTAGGSPKEWHFKFCAACTTSCKDAWESQPFTWLRRIQRVRHAQAARSLHLCWHVSNA